MKITISQAHQLPMVSFMKYVMKVVILFLIDKLGELACYN
jgi:hypothetical protein